VDDRVWKNISLVLGVICAVLIGVAGVLMVYGGGTATPTAGDNPSAIANVTGTPNNPGSTGTGSPGTTPTAPGSAGPASQATIIFNSMKLDAEKDSNAKARTFSFQTNGAGPVSWAVTKISPSGSVRMCASVDQGQATCKVGGVMSSKGAMSDSTADKPSTWTVTFYGYGDSTPTVDVQLSWPTSDAKVTLNHGRFQGSSTEGVSEALNGFTATFKPRKSGSINVQASWTDITADVKIDLFDSTVNPPQALDSKAYSGVNFVKPAYTYNVDSSKTYQVKLRDQSADAQRPDLTAVVQFP
jgi:hypothetical protein